MFDKGKKATLISLFLILILISGLGFSVYGEETITDKQDSETPIDQSQEEASLLNSPELIIKENENGSEYSSILTGIQPNSFDYIILKVWNDESDFDAFLCPMNIRETDEEDSLTYEAYIPVNNHELSGIYQVIAYGIKETESINIESVNDITIEMLSNDEIAIEIANSSFEFSNSEDIITLPSNNTDTLNDPDSFGDPDVIEKDMAIMPKAALKASPSTPSGAIQGIDVSHHQGTINWSKVKAAGIKFAIIRCGYGEDTPSQDDRQWQNNVSQCEKLGIPYGVYIYSHATSEKKARSEADHCLRLLIGHKPSYPVFLDLEDEDLDGLSNGSLAAITKVWADKIQSSGYQPGVYSNKYWWTNKLTDSRMNNYCKWVAQWSTSCTYTGTYAMWQYTSEGTVNGINTNVDMD